MTTHPVGELLPWAARPVIPDPAEAPAGTPEDRCDRCRKGNHRFCPDQRQFGVCCCEVDE